MKHQLKKRLLDYFKSIKHKNELEEELLVDLEEDSKYFDVSCVCRDDLKEICKCKVEDIPDYEMSIVANVMNDNYLSYSYWDDLMKSLKHIGAIK